MARVGQERQRARQQAEYRLDRDISEVEPDPERECPIIAGRGMMVVIMAMGVIVAMGTTLPRARGPARRRSARAWSTICQPPEMPKPAMIAATMTSGQPVPVPNTPAAASSTARLPIASLREQIQTERMLASPPR